MNNKLLQQAYEIMEKSEREEKLEKLYYNLLKNGYRTREAKRYMKKKYNYIVKS